MSPYPLEAVSTAQLRELCGTLWSWQPCSDCADRGGCQDVECPWKRMKKLSFYLIYYQNVTAVYEPDMQAQRDVALPTHEDLFGIIKILKSQPVDSRARLNTDVFANRAISAPTPSDQKAAIDMAVAVLTMTDISYQRTSPSMLERGSARVGWRLDESFADFFEKAFPLDGDVFSGKALALNAVSLKKQLALRFRATDDIRNHLKLNRDENYVEVFHQTAFLKEHLRLTKDEPPDLSFEDCLKKGAIPREIALEILDSIQKVLFPRSDKKSRRLLQSLISKSGFDPDCDFFESASIRRPEERDVIYKYFGARLADLLEELENPSPRSWLERRVQRKAGPRYVMMAAIAGIAVAVILGFLSLIVECFSAWVGYQQWKNHGG